MKDEWKLVTEYTLTEYPVGFQAGDRVRLKRLLEIKDHRGRMTGERHEPGEIWTILPGVVDEPQTIWLMDPDGSRQTWDETVVDWFESEEAEQ